MPNRHYLLSIRLFHAFREACFGDEKYTSSKFFKDILSGITVGIIAIPLAMALAIASGVAPQYGIYTAIFGGFIIALTGGSRYSVSGPTAAFVVILYPIVQQYGLGGLLLASLMSGVLLIIMALGRVGRFIEYIPNSVTLGFTGGIAIVIATIQVKDFFGLHIDKMPELYVQKVMVLIHQLPGLSWANVGVAVATLAVMVIWPRFKTPVPAHLLAVIVGSFLALVLNDYGFAIDTIGTRFHYLLPDGSAGAGIPPYFPHFEWPWLRVGLDGRHTIISWQMIRDLIPSAFAIAMLGAIESLLCAVVLDGMTGKRHSANSELLGQGIGNLVTPFFGGIVATAAIARSAANYKAGAQSPISSMIHALVVLASLVIFAQLLSYLPMASMAALLMVVSWQMSEAPKSFRLIRTAPRADVAVFLTCLSLTVFFDMVIAITTGVLLAAILFMKEIALLTRVTDITDNKKMVNVTLPDGWQVIKINGPLFFAAADRIFNDIATLSSTSKGLILYMDGVSLLDSGGLSSMNKMIEDYKKSGSQIFFADFQYQPLKTLARAGIKPIEGVSKFFPSLSAALREVSQLEIV